MVANKTVSLQMCQINVSGLSPQSYTALNRYNNHIKNDILAIQETMFDPNDATKTQPSFNNMETYYLHNDRGVSLSIKTSLYPQRISELEDTITDTIWATFNCNSKTMLVGNVYINPNTTSANSLKASLKNVDRARTYCHKFKIKDITILGDFNSRNTKWGDSTCNNRGKLLDEYIMNNNFICASPNAQTFLCSNGGSTIDLAILSASVANLYNTSSADNEVELFSGAPLRGHIPVIHQFKLPGTSNMESQEMIYKDFKNTDWDR